MYYNNGCSEDNGAVPGIGNPEAAILRRYKLSVENLNSALYTLYAKLLPRYYLDGSWERDPFQLVIPYFVSVHTHVPLVNVQTSPGSVFAPPGNVMAFGAPPPRTTSAALLSSALTKLDVINLSMFDMVFLL